MSGEDHESLITKFQNISGQEKEGAIFYLESAGWNIEIALGSFYEANAIEEGIEEFGAANNMAGTSNVEEQSDSNQESTEETEGIDTAGIERLHKFQQDMNKIIEERDANRLVKDNPFQGPGNVLGSSKHTENSNSSQTSDVLNTALSDSEAQKRVNVDNSKPMTTLQVRLSSGDRLIIKLNENSTVGDLRSYIYLVRPNTPENISFHTTFPNKEYSDDSVTLRDAGLLGAAILMRLKSMPVIVN